MSDYQNALGKFTEEQVSGFQSPNGKIIFDQHQQQAMSLLSEGLLSGEQAMSIVHSCGSGKTVIEGALAIASQKAKAETSIGKDNIDIIISTERSLIYSIRDQLVTMGVDLGVWGAGEKRLDRPVILASIQAMQSDKAKFSATLPPDKVSLVIGDEADLYLTDKRKDAIKMFQNAVRIGLTATPTWPDGRDIEEVWGRKIHEMKLKEGILNGVNVPPLFSLFEVNLDGDKLAIDEGDYDKKILGAAMREAELQKAIPEIYKALIPENRRKDFPTLVFVPSANLVHATQEELKKQLKSTNLVITGWTGESTTQKTLQDEISDFNNGKIDILVLCEMGGRGLDLPRARCLIDGYPTLSPNKLEQRHGRVLRRIRAQNDSDKSVNKPFALIAQIIPQSQQFRPYLLPDLLDCWPDFEAGKVLVGREQQPGGGDNGGDVGAPIQDEVNALKEHLLENLGRKKGLHVRKVEEINILHEIVLRNNLPQSDETGFFEKEGKKYGTAHAWSRVLGISPDIIFQRFKGTQGITGKDIHGVIRHNAFYEEVIVREKCADQMAELPQADANGFFEKEGKKYGTANAWGTLFSISPITVKKRLVGIIGISGKEILGKINSSYYEESIVKEKCADLLGEIPQADANGFFEKDGKKYGAIGSWAKKLDISDLSIKSRLGTIESVKVKTKMGHVHDFYEEGVVREKCADLLAELPQADENGFFEKDGKKYGTVGSWLRSLGLSNNTSSIKRVEGLPSIKARDKMAKVRDFYEESVIREKYADLLAELPQADEDGFFEKDGKKYGTISRFATLLDISIDSISKRLEGVTPTKGKAKMGQVLDFYEESVVREKCTDLLAELPQADEDGFFEKDGKIYGTVGSWSKKIDINTKSVRKRLGGVTPIKAKSKMKKVLDFYEESIVREKCADLSEEMSQADENGFFEKDGKKYGTSSSWSIALKISQQATHRRLKDLEATKARSSNGNIQEFYEESVVREQCADLFEELPQADESGFFEKDGKKYGTVNAWARIINRHPATIKKRLGEIKGITGKSANGKIFTESFYEESLIYEKLNIIPE